jgi:hypothetical protein
MTATATPPTQGFTPEVHWGRFDGQLKPYSRDPEGNIVLLTWAPMPGSQTAFLECSVQEVLYCGSRGPGKTDALLMSFAQHIGKWGKDWRGIIFRRTYPELEDVIGKADKWFSEIFPDATYNKGKHFWEWPGGERLYFGHIRVPSDYNKYHGHNYPFLGFEEITTWPSKDCFVTMLSTNRTTNPNVPKMVRATTNPSGVGHNWCKARYKLPVKPGGFFGELCGGDTMVDEKGKPILDNQGKPMLQPERIAIHGDINENFLLLDADPGYKATIAASASSPSQLKAWLHGSWDVVAGGMFDDLWDSTVHIVEPFKIPKSWRIDRSFDWGSSKPSSVGWWAESDGSDYIDAAGFTVNTVRGDLFRIHEWYMCKKGEENKGLMLTDREIANGIKDMQLQHPMLMGKAVQPGPADTSIYDTTNGQSIAKAMANMGVRWTRADKSAGSRILGWQRIRNRLQASFKKDGLPREHPGLFVFDTCDAFIRTVPVAPRDDRNTEDLDSESEDHICTVGSTVVYTPEGPRTIESLVGTEGLIWTPCGWQWYESCRLTKKDTPVITVEYPGLESMTLTPDHRIAGSEGWDFSEVIRRPVLCQTPQYSQLRCRSSKAHVTTCAENTFRTTESGFTEWSGKPQTERFQTGAMCITTTKIAQTTDSAILSCSPPNNTSLFTCRPLRQRRGHLHHLSLPETLLRNGTDQKQARNGTSSSTQSIAKARSTQSLRRLANDAAISTRELSLQDSVPITAKQRREEILASIMLNGSVSSAELSFPSASISKRPHVPVPVGRSSGGRSVIRSNAGNSDVYCLKVPVTGCFVANGGWLLSNCDETRYKIFSRTGKMVNKKIRGR